MENEDIKKDLREEGLRYYFRNPAEENKIYINSTIIVGIESNTNNVEHCITTKFLQNLLISLPVTEYREEGGSENSHQ